MPPAARGRFLKKLPPGPPQKFFIKAVMVCNLKESMQTMTAVGLFFGNKVKKEIEGFDTQCASNFSSII